MNNVLLKQLRECPNDSLAQRAADEIESLQNWVADCQSGMYINCVYCGHRYGPQDEVPSSMADVLREHVEQCPKHPLSAVKAEIERLRSRVRTLEEEGAKTICPDLLAEIARLKRELAEQKENHNDTILGRIVAREVAKMCYARIRPHNIPDMPKGAYDKWCNALLQRHPWLEDK